MPGSDYSHASSLTQVVSNLPRRRRRSSGARLQISVPQTLSEDYVEDSSGVRERRQGSSFSFDGYETTRHWNTEPLSPSEIGARRQEDDISPKYARNQPNGGTDLLLSKEDRTGCPEDQVETQHASSKTSGEGSNQQYVYSMGGGSSADEQKVEVAPLKFTCSLMDTNSDSSVSNDSVVSNRALDLLAKEAVSKMAMNGGTPTPSMTKESTTSSSSSNDSKMAFLIQQRNEAGKLANVFRGHINNSGVPRRYSDARTNSLELPPSLETTARKRTVRFTPLERIPYVHGSYAAAAPLMLHDNKWMKILRHLMPEAHADAVNMLTQDLKARKALFPNAVRIMKWAENNPVVAAYGMLHSNAGSSRHLITNSPQRNISPRGSADRVGSNNHVSPNSSFNTHIQTLEWDVFLDPNLVRKVDAALQASEEAKQSDDMNAVIAAQVEADRQVGRLISRMILAHGSTSQLVAEAIGFIPQHNFASVVEQGESQRLHRRRRKQRQASLTTSGLIREWKAERRESAASAAANPIVPVAPGKGSAKSAGIFVERWMAIFATALMLAQETDDRIDDFESLDKYGQLLEILEEDVEIRQVKPTMCGMFLCLGYEDPNSKRADHSKTSMAMSALEIKRVLGGPLSLVLDLKSRRVPPRVWARLVDTLRSRGVGVAGLGSFDMEELRSIANACSAPVTSVIFFHSAGDLQRACHAQEVKRGDTVYFNAGSLIWPKPNVIAKMNCCQSEDYAMDPTVVQEVVFHPCAYPQDRIPERFMTLECKSTLQHYQRRLDLRIGVYVQEFSISDRILDEISKFVNEHPTIYNLGLAWGGVNGKTTPGVPGDGYWNQRYMGRAWDLKAEVTDEMHLLHIEDHHLVKKALGAGAWGAIGSVNPVNDVGGDATGDGASLNFETCQPIQ